MEIVAIEGHDGAGKTPVVEGLELELSKMGVRTARFAPFYQVKNLIEEADIYPYWAGDETAEVATRLILDLIKKDKEEAAKAKAEVVIFDRHWMTVFTEILERPNLIALWDEWPKTIFLTTDPKHTFEAKRFSRNVPWTNSEEMVTFYNQRYYQVRDAFPDKVSREYPVLTRDQGLSIIIRDIITLLGKS